MAQYLSDSDAMYPLHYSQTSGDPNPFVAWLQPYAKNQGIFLCPDAPNAVTTLTPPDTDIKDYTWRAGGYKGSYSLNGLLQNIPESSVAQSAHTAEFMDNRWFSDAGYGMNLRYCGRHFGGVNVAYTDGHVKWIALSDAAENLNFSP
jgi:prepilin-type processing-associated H-X9-DG protein